MTSENNPFGLGIRAQKARKLESSIEEVEAMQAEHNQSGLLLLVQSADVMRAWMQLRLACDAYRQVQPDAFALGADELSALPHLLLRARIQRLLKRQDDICANLEQEYSEAAQDWNDKLMDEIYGPADRNGEQAGGLEEFRQAIRGAGRAYGFIRQSIGRIMAGVPLGDIIDEEELREKVWRGLQVYGKEHYPKYRSEVASQAQRYKEDPTASLQPTDWGEMHKAEQGRIGEKIDGWKSKGAIRTARMLQEVLNQSRDTFLFRLYMRDDRTYSLVRLLDHTNLRLFFHTIMRHNIIRCGMHPRLKAEFEEWLGVKEPVAGQGKTSKAAGAAHPGHPKGVLFIKREKGVEVENATTKNMWKIRFKSYLENDPELKGYLLDKEDQGFKSLSGNKSVRLNKVIVCFLAKWKERNYIAANPSGGAILRFLKECGIKLEVEDKPYTNNVIHWQVDPDEMKKVEKAFLEWPPEK